MKNATSEFEIDPQSDFVVGDLNLEQAGRLQRLKAVVRQSGGNKAVAEKSGIPLSNLGAYLAGREMKVPALIALAKACGVNLVWLATGEGPMVGELQAAASQPAPAPQKSAPERPFRAFAQIKLDVLTEAYLEAQAKFDEANVVAPAREMMQVTLLFYDLINKP